MGPLPSGDVTFLFTDIEASTRLFHELDRRYPELQAAALEAVTRAVDARDGAVVRTEGDAVFAAFSEAAAAATAAVEAQRRLALLETPRPVKVRMGLHTGAASPVGDDYVSLAVHLAARVAGAANGGQILLSEATAHLVGDSAPEGSVILELGRFRLRGFPRPHRLFELVIADLPRAGRPRAPGQAGNLDTPITSFVGRDRDVEAVATLLSAHRLVSIVGSGGIGKTRLAKEVAATASEEFSGGAWFVPLASRGDARAPAELLARALGLETGDSSALIEELRESRALVVLDNCEHMKDAAAAFVGELVEACSDLTVLATSREPLGIPGECLYWLAPLDINGGSDGPGSNELPAAVALFVERANLVRPREWTSAELEAARRICAGLDGVPLAIELAAARTAVFTPADIAARLGKRFQFLTSNAPPSTPHHRSLRAALEWSEALLSDDERDVLRRLSVFRGGFTLEAAERVALPGSVDDVVEIVASLVLKSLIVHTAEGDESRYSMLESVRHYAHELLVATGSVEAVQRAHAQWCMELALAAAPNLHGSNQTEWLDRLEREHENLRAGLQALASLVPAEHLSLALLLRKFWYVRGLWHVARAEFERSLAFASTQGVQSAWAMTALADFAMAEGEYADARTLLDEALAIAGTSADKELLAEVLLLRGSLAAREDDARCFEWWDAAVDAARRCGRLEVAAEASAAAGAARARRGDIARGRSDLASAEQSARIHGDVRTLAFVLNRLGVVELTAGAVDSARAKLVEAASLVRALGDRNAEAGCLFHLAGIVEAEDPDEAGRMLETVVALATSLGDHEGIAVASCRLARLKAARGEAAAAGELYAAAERSFLRLGRHIDAAAAAAARVELMQQRTSGSR